MELTPFLKRGAGGGPAAAYAAAAVLNALSFAHQGQADTRHSLSAPRRKGYQKLQPKEQLLYVGVEDVGTSSRQ